MVDRVKYIVYNEHIQTHRKRKMTILDQLAPGLTEQEVLSQAYAIMLKEQGFKAAVTILVLTKTTQVIWSVNTFTIRKRQHNETAISSIGTV